jgi:hypothetical protein
MRIEHLSFPDDMRTSVIKATRSRTSRIRIHHGTVSAVKKEPERK